VRIIPVIGAGRTLISKGFLSSAKAHGIDLVNSIIDLDPFGIYPIIGIEPSEIYTLRDELPDLLPDDEQVLRIKKRALMIDEFLVRPDNHGKLRINQLIDDKSKFGEKHENVFLHGHCYQKAQPPAEDNFPTGIEATIYMLEKAGYQVHLIDDGCCGMAGGFGYESDHYNLSMDIGEIALFPAVRQALASFGDQVIIAAAGVSCQSQIEDGTTVKAIHPIRLIDRIL
jgi:hypothetical protein